jgi:hypothetical protein
MYIHIIPSSVKVLSKVLIGKLFHRPVQATRAISPNATLEEAEKGQLETHRVQALRYAQSRRM